MGLIRINGKRVRKPGTCMNHACAPVKGHVHCQVCLDRLKAKYIARGGHKVWNHRCLRCERKGKRKWKGRLCCYCRRILKNNPEAEIRGSRR